MKLTLILFLFINFTIVVNSHPPGSRQDAEKASTKACFFKEVRQQEQEKNERPRTSKVSTNCGGSEKKMIDVNSLELDNLYGSSTVLDLLLCRGAALCEESEDSLKNIWGRKSICEFHIRELLTGWKNVDHHSQHRLSNGVLQHYQAKKTLSFQKRTPVCSLPTTIGFQHRLRPVATGSNYQFVTKDETLMILKEYQTLVSPGTCKYFQTTVVLKIISDVCLEHKEFLQEKVKAQKDVIQTSEEVWIDPEEPMEVDEDTCTLDEESGSEDYESQDHVTVRKSQPKTCPPLQTALHKFAKLAKIKRVSFSKSYKDLTDATKQKKVCTAKRLIDVIFETMAPDAADELRDRVMLGSSDMYSRKKDDKLGKLMEYIAESFRTAENRAQRYTILSMVAKTIPLSQIRTYIPGLSYHMFNVARKYKMFQVEEKRKLEISNPYGTNLFIDFITSNVIMSPYTFGGLKTKTTSGVVVELPKTIRKQSASEIIHMFKMLLKETEEEEFRMADSTYYKILSSCPAITQKSSTCVDYYVADAVEGVDQIKFVLAEWKEKNALDASTYKRLVTDLEDVLHYFRTDFRLHVKQQSRIADHCGQHALSNPNDPDLATKCNHEHDLYCDRCEHAKSVLEEIHSLTTGFVEEAEKKLKKNKKSMKQKLVFDNLQSNEEDIESGITKLVELKKHLLRVKVTDEQRTGILGSLNEYEALLTLDYAQKLLPQKYNEKQAEYFGKRGMSWHITHVTANISSSLVTHSFIHLIEDDKQDTDAVTAIITHVLQELEVMGIKKVHLRSDNAGCYHSASTIGSLPEITKKTSVQVVRYAFSEPQNGKSHCDRVANIAKRKMHTFVDSGNDVSNLEEFFTSLTNNIHKPMKGTSVYRGTITRPTHEAKDRTKIKDIFSYYDFVYTKGSVVMHHYNGIGKGKTLKTKEFKPNKSVFVVTEKGGWLTSQHLKEQEKVRIMNNEDTYFWYTRKCATSVCRAEKTIVSNIVTEEEQTQVINPNEPVYFRCSTPGCSASFRYAANLEKHVLVGKHNIAPEKLTLKDYSLQKFISNIEEVDNAKEILPEVADAVNALEVSTKTQIEPQGWAFKTKKLSGRFSVLVRTYLTNEYEEGQKTGRKVDGDAVEKKMRKEKRADGTRMFVKSDRVNSKQINSFFSRLTSNENDSTMRAIRSAVEVTVSTEEENVEEEEVHDPEKDEYSEQFQMIGFKDPNYATSPDIEIRKEVRKSETIFERKIETVPPQPYGEPMYDNHDIPDDDDEN